MEDRPTRARLIGGSRFYAVLGWVCAGIVFCGFARTFFLWPLFREEPLTALLIAHGVSMSLWVALLLVQSRLVAQRKIAQHRRLGMAGVVLLALIALLGATVTISSARQNGALGIMPTTDFALFTVLVGVGLWKRNRPETHKRLMALGTLVMLLPAIARIPLDALHAGGAYGLMAVSAGITLLTIAVDTHRHRRLHPAFAWGGALFLLSMPGRMWIASTPTWDSLSKWLVS